MRETGDRELSSDLCQQALQQVWEAMQEGKVRSAGALPAFARTCALRLLALERQQPITHSLDIALELPADAMSPLEFLERSQFTELANRVYRELSERERAVLHGFYIAGLTKSELMAQWNITHDQFNKALSRARLRMRELVNDQLNKDHQSRPNSFARPSSSS
jgi:RNA polymerase sigma factor (sigma-70 family)